MEIGVETDGQGLQKQPGSQRRNDASRVVSRSGDQHRRFSVSGNDVDGRFSIADQYGFRYDVEPDIKSAKVAMGTENITAQSEAMVMKELYTSLTAHNLVVQYRRQAAELAVSSVELPRRLGHLRKFSLDLLVDRGDRGVRGSFRRSVKVRLSREDPKSPWTQLQTCHTPTPPQDAEVAEGTKKESIQQDQSRTNPARSNKVCAIGLAPAGTLNAGGDAKLANSCGKRSRMPPDRSRRRFIGGETGAAVGI